MFHLANMLQVRPFRLEDAGAVEPWLTGPGLSLPCGVARTTWPERLLADSRIVAQIAVVDGQRVGFVRLDCGPDRIAEITLVIAPGSRRAGLGCTMFRSVLEHARRLGLRRMVAIVDLGNEAAQAFFHEQGFQADGLLGDRIRLARIVHAGDHQRPLEIEV
jgi:RimJ/RimL family protein N-acetyltransferase